MSIHPTAIIDRHAELDASVEIGPYVIIDGPVKIGARTRVIAHAWLTGCTTIGEDCTIFPFSTLGALPQDFHHKGERSYCRIGNRVTVREGVTVHRGTQPESSTIVGDGCGLMVQSHVGHNVELAEGVTVLNTAQIAGHVHIGPRAILSAGALIHQFVRIGELAFVAANARVSSDVPPFMMCFGECTIVGVNRVGLQRAGLDLATRREIRAAHRLLYRSGLPSGKSVAQLADMVQTEAGQRLLSFLRSESKRGFAVGGTHLGRRFGTGMTDVEDPQTV